MKSTTKALILLSIFEILLTGCFVFTSVSPTTPTSPPPSYNIDGKWLGYTQNGGSVLVEINDRTIKTLNLDVLNPNNCEEIFSALGGEFEIQGNKFVANVALYHTEGTFVSDEFLSGVIKLSASQQNCYSTEEIQWTAHKAGLTNIEACEVIDTNNSVLRDEPISESNASCFILGSRVLVRYAPGDLVPPGGYYVWLPEYKSVLSEGFNWQMWDPITGVQLSQLVRNGNALLDPASLKPIITWSEQDLSYIANINLYETVDYPK